MHATKGNLQWMPATGKQKKAEPAGTKLPMPKARAAQSYKPVGYQEDHHSSPTVVLDEEVGYDPTVVLTEVDISTGKSKKKKSKKKDASSSKGRSSSKSSQAYQQSCCERFPPALLLIG
jgi:hypothetical protein